MVGEDHFPYPRFTFTATHCRKIPVWELAEVHCHVHDRTYLVCFDY